MEIVRKSLVCGPVRAESPTSPEPKTGHDLPSLYRETSEGGLAKEYNN